MTTRRSFLKASALAALTPCVAPFNLISPVNHGLETPLISLAQWSLKNSIRSGELLAENFPVIAKNNYDLNAVEYVARFYTDYLQNAKYWEDLKNRADSEGVKNLLIMVDDQGDLGNPTSPERKRAVENHYPWVDVAKQIGCHSIRINAFGEGSPAAVKDALVDGIGGLCNYAGKAGINIIIENHGLYSSQPDFILDLIKQVNSPYLGTLPDFGNWCTTAKWGSTQDGTCESVYNPEEGVKRYMPYAKAMSAKSYTFDSNGDQPIIDYRALLKVVKDAGYTGYIGIEYEGTGQSEPEGIRATKALIEKIWAEI